MSEFSAKIQTEKIPSNKFYKQPHRGAATTGFDADSDSELILGTIFGLRGWDQDPLGRLIPVSIGTTPFKPGVNVAECRYASTEMRTYRDDKGVKRTVTTKPTIRDHSMAKCSCGYHAYFDDHTADSRHGTVGGIVEGSGLAVIGEKGFRVEKAELKALIVRPSRHDGHTPGFWSWLAKWVLPSNARLAKMKHFDRNSDRNRMFGWFGALLVVSSIAFLFASIFSIITEVQNSSAVSGWWLPTALALFFAFFAVSWLNITEGFPEGNKSSYLASTRGGSREVRLIREKSVQNLGDPNNPYSAARLAKLYPDVPIYFSIKAATKDFPLTSVDDFVPPPSDLPTPETTDDFWNLRDDKYL